ncbi:MAG: DPP IV N-terminal domain-containing protein [Deltaproteobacteria bacterium]|nr:DPP IV N-terminal domain-containing protein [Deltaproteobacteria bacterium]
MRLRTLFVALALLTAPACGGAPSSDRTCTTPMRDTTSIADTAFLEQYAVTYRFNQGHPGHFVLTPDASAVLFLRSGARSFVNDLYVLDVATGQERVLLTAEQVLGGAEESLSEEERARRERMRLAARGIAGFDLSPDGASILVPLSGRLFLVDRARAGQSGSVREIGSETGYPIDPRFSPDGTRIALVRDGDLFVIDVATGHETRITQHAGAHIERGAAEFVAQEEMGRFEGYWWSPDSRSLLVQETDTSAVETMHILDPMHPENEPNSPPYPRPGRANATVRIGLVTLGAAAGSERWVEWDRERYPYLATVRWPASGPVVLVQDRLQQNELLLSVDVATLATSPILTETDAAWLNLDQDVPRFVANGTQFLWTSERDGETQLELRGRDGTLVRTLTPTGFGYQSLLAVDEANARVLVSGSANPTEMHVWEIPLAGGAPRQLTSGSAVHEAVFSRDASVWVHVARGRGAARTATVARTSDGTTLATIQSVAEAPSFEVNVAFEEVGARGFRAAIVRPRDFDATRRYPVIVYVYGGPGHRQVTVDRDRWLLPQWFADHGFVVVSFDGRGTPGRGREWERVIREDFISVPLEDQVAAVQAAGAAHPEMDLGRVGIYGWSFGGYFSAMAVLRRPDVFHAGIAGAPVSEWRDYDTHYTERFLGLPEEDGVEGAYTRSSVLTFAARDPGNDPLRPLLIVHGTADDNVYFSHAVKMSDAMFRAGRPFEFLPLAGLTHMVPDPAVSRRLQTRIVEFFQRNLGAPAR